MSTTAASVSRFPARFDLNCGQDEQWDIDDLAAIELRRMLEHRERDERAARARLRHWWLGRLAVAAIFARPWFWIL